MCRLIRSHPIKSIFLLIVLVSCIHLTHKLLLTNLKQFSHQNTLIIAVESNNLSYNSVTKTNDLRPCQVDPHTLKSAIPVNQTAATMKELESKPWAANLVEGAWSPTNCSSNNKVAIIIPYRNREEHLKIFLNHMHPFLQKQMITYGIFVIEQAAGTRFNRAALFNVGFKEALKKNLVCYDCFIFHDVDLLPSNEQNFYTCSASPLHMSVAVDKFNYKLPYQAIFGGAVALSHKHFLQVNGFSNIFFGWGGEDDDMSSRLSFNGLSIHRYPDAVARYVMIKHNVDKGNPINPLRFDLLKKSKERNQLDGFKSLSYDVVVSGEKVSPLYRLITVQFPEADILKQWNLPKG